MGSQSLWYLIVAILVTAGNALITWRLWRSVGKEGRSRVREGMLRVLFALIVFLQVAALVPLISIVADPNDFRSGQAVGQLLGATILIYGAAMLLRWIWDGFAGK